MNNFEVEQCLESLSVIVDTREHVTDKLQNRLSIFPHYTRQKLEYGDYTFNFCTPSGSLFYKEDEKIFPDIVIERKMGLEELSYCFAQERKRFVAEFERAKERGAKVYLLVENANFENLYNGKYRTKLNIKSFVGSLFAFCARYNAVPIFCKSETAGKVIYDILYRELKERLTRGDYG